MIKLKLLVIALIVALFISVGFNIYVSNQNQTLTNQKSTLNAQLEMTTILTRAQVGLDAELQRIGSSLIYASTQLSVTGIEGDQTRAVVSALAANSSFIIDAATQDLNNTMIIVEPSAYRSSEGRNVGKQVWLNPNPNCPITPAMTPVIPLVENLTGVALAAPVFDQNGTMIGTVSVIFNAGILLNASVTQAVAGTTYTMWATQTDGLVIYDADPAQQGLMLFSDPAYEQYPQMLTVMHQIVDQSAGHSNYQYLKTLASGEFVSKECFWTTISAYGGEWRLVIVHVLNS